jgi:hypothetical protein
MNRIELPLRILANASFGTGPKRPPRHDVRVDLSPKPPATVNTQNIIEGEVARIIDAPPAHGESVQRAFDRKEHELRALFASLTRHESIALHSKLSTSSLLARLTAERRNRVIARLAEKAGGQ